jgi:hypothetical protein
MKWRFIEFFNDGRPAAEPWWEIAGRECRICLEARPPYCDRGNWYAKIEPTGALARDLDWSDGWPRYYFDFDRAKLEIEAWLTKRGQAL